MNLRDLSLLLLTASCAGCASIVSGTTQEVAFHSTPEGATVQVDAKVVGKTPLTLALKRSEHVSVSFSKDGYKRLTLPMGQRLTGWFWGNVVVGGLFGSTTDGVSGAAHEYSPNQFVVSLEPLKAGRLEVETAKSPVHKAREFIILGYNGIQTDLARGKGNYLHSLLKALEISEDKQAEAVKKIRALSQAYDDIPEFADRVVSLYLPGEAVAEEDGRDEELFSGSWEDALKGSNSNRYDILISTDHDHSVSYAKSMRHSQKEEMCDFILGEKGSASTTSWKFQMRADLSERERNFIRWFLPKYSSYKPFGY